MRLALPYSPTPVKHGKPTIPLPVVGAVVRLLFGGRFYEDAEVIAVYTSRVKVRFWLSDGRTKEKTVAWGERPTTIYRGTPALAFPPKAPLVAAVVDGPQIPSTMICDNCGEEFRGIEAIFVNNAGAVCSQECEAAALRSLAGMAQ